MKLTLQARVSDDKNADQPAIIGEVELDLPEKVSTVVAKSSRIASFILSAANRIKQELEHGRP